MLHNRCARVPFNSATHARMPVQIVQGHYLCLMLLHPWRTPACVLLLCSASQSPFVLPGGHSKWRKRPLEQAGGDWPHSKVLEVCPDAAEQLKQQQEVYQSSSSAQSMMQFRAQLPSFHMRNAFLSALDAHQVASSTCWLRFLQFVGAPLRHAVHKCTQLIET